ncbi:MAG: signal peptidase I [Clostridia bacterium]|nr:signal peptidase I [Clostridia bacterium]
MMTFLFRFFTVDGESMMNTLLNKDKVAVVRWNYVPTQGDVVVIKHGQNFDKPLIKRIIATQGQTLKIDFDEGTVTVNNVKLEEPYIKEKMWLTGDNDIPEVIPDGYCFVMGDNRNNSGDSRHTMIGLIPNEDIVGKAKFIVYPFNRMGVITSYNQTA